MPHPVAHFYWRWIKVAWHPSWGITDTIASMLGLFLPPVAKLIGISEATMTELAWQISFGVLLFLVTARLLVAPYLMFKEEQKRINELEQELARQKAKLRLDGEQRMVMWGTDPFSDFEYCIVIISMIIRNRGEPSIVERWKASVATNDGHRTEGQIFIKDDFEISDPSGSGDKRIFTKRDIIITKAMTPIPTGGAVTGYLAVRFPGHSLDELKHRDASLVVEFSDIDGVVYECHGPTGTAPYGLKTHFPGE